MANPSSSHHRDSRERERERHHHHRTISSTTLLLVLSLILAVLAVMLSLPSNRIPVASPAVPIANTNMGNPGNPGNPSNLEGTPPNQEPANGFWTYLSPRRSQALVAREHDVAIREAEVAKREADLLAGAYVGPPVVSAISCPPCQTVYATAPAPPPETIIKEVVREIQAIEPSRGAAEIRMEDVMQREEKVSDREKQVGSREEVVGKRESDASRRENWIMEQLITLGNDPAPIAVEREEFVYDVPKNRKVPPVLRQ